MRSDRNADTNSEPDADRVVIEWPSGRTDEFKGLRAGSYECVEGQAPKS